MISAALLVAAVLCPLPATAQAAGGAVQIMSLAEVTAGMRGSGLTVVQGWQPQRFDVEILGVLPDVFPKQSLIIARLSGLDLERSGVVAGMSGSPVYVDDRLIGAVAYRLVSFGYEAIAGIMPIENMLAMRERSASGSTGGSAGGGAAVVHLLQDAAALLTGGAARPVPAQSVAAHPGIEPIATPLAMAGFDARLVGAIAPLFAARGWLVGAGAGAAQVQPYLEPGGVVAVQLVRGDIAVTAAGTVTHRDGDRLLAFGHPFLQAGAVDFPMVGAEVLTVLSASQASSKLTVAGREVLGAIRQDRLPAILGVVGATPRLLPVAVRLSAAGVQETLDFEVVADPLLTPLYVFLGLVNGVQSIDEIGTGGSLELATTVQLGDGLQLRFDDLYSSNDQAIIGAAADLAGVFAGLYDNSVAPADLRSVQIDLTLRADRRVATVARVWHDGAAVRPGEELQLSVALDRYRQPQLVMRVPVRIPDDLAAGPLRVLVGDATAAAAAHEQALGGLAPPRDLAELAGRFNDRRRRDQLYVQLLRPLAGARIGGQSMPGLPGSRLRMLGGGSDVVALGEMMLVDQAVPAGGVVAGSQSITVTVRVR